jgi:hypothetical protein
MNEEQTTQVLVSLGRIEQKIDSHTLWMTAHVAEDKLLATDVAALKISHARQRGFMTALAGVGGLVSGAVGYAVEFFHRS